jgi:hypothetical protein
MIGDDECGAVGEMRTGRGKPKYSEKTYPSAPLSTKNPTWPDPGSKSDLRGGNPATNRLSYGTANNMLSFPNNYRIPWDEIIRC